MHHKQMFYQTLKKDNDEFDQTYQKNFKNTHTEMDEIYRGARGPEADLQRRGLGESSGQMRRQTRSKSHAKPPQMSLNIINSEIKNFARRKNRDECQFKRKLDEKMMVKAARNNEMVSNITAGILRKEIEKNLRELKKTHKKLVEVEQGKDFATKTEMRPKSTKETDQDQMTSSKLMQINRELQRPPKRIHQEHEVLLLNKDARPRPTEWNQNKHENDYLEEVLQKARPLENVPSTREATLGAQKRFLVGQDKARKTLTMNEKVQNKTLIRGVLGTVGKSHMAEEFYDGERYAQQCNPKTMAEELFDTIKLRSKFASLEKNKKEGLILPMDAALDPVNNIETLKASLKFEKWPRKQFGNSLKLEQTQQNVQHYLANVLSGRKEFDVYADPPIESSTQSKNVFGYLETLKNTFDLKNSLNQKRQMANLTG